MSKSKPGRPDDMIPGPQYEDTPEDYMGPIQFLNWGGYKIAVYGASRLTVEFFDEIAARRRSNRSVIIIVTGSPGEGKSYLAMRFCEIFDQKFTVLDTDDERTKTPGKDPSQIPFERESFLHLIGVDSPLDYGQCVLPDEAQYTMGARRWYEDLQKDLMESIESVRSKGLIIVIVSLHLDLLDRIVRKFVLTYMFHVEDRGRAVIYRLYTPRFETEMRKRRIGEIMLKLPSTEQCSHSDCLRCDYSHIRKGIPPDTRKCKTNRAKYERRKKAFVDGRSAAAQAKSEAKRVKDRIVTDDEMADTIYENKEKIVRKASGKMDPVSLQIIIEDEYGVSIGTQKCYKIRSRLEQKYPELRGTDKVYSNEPQFQSSDKKS